MDARGHNVSNQWSKLVRFFLDQTQKVRRGIGANSVQTRLAIFLSWREGGCAFVSPQKVNVVNSTYFGLLAEFGEANIPLARVAPKYFGLSFEEARRRAPTQMLPCRAFRLGGQKSPWLVSAVDLAELIDRRRGQVAKRPESLRENGAERPRLPAA